MELLKRIKGSDIRRQSPLPRELTPQEELIFYIPEGADPLGGLTPGEQAQAFYNAQYFGQRLIEIVRPTTQMLHTAAVLRNGHDLGKTVDVKKGQGEQSISYTFLGWTIARRMAKVEVVEREQKKTQWIVNKDGYIKDCQLGYSIYPENLTKIDWYKMHYKTSRQRQPFATFDLKFNDGQQLISSALSWDQIYPEFLAEFMGTNKTLAAILKGFGQPNSAFIRGLVKTLATVRPDQVQASTIGSIQFNLGHEPTIDISVKDCRNCPNLESTFEFQASQDRFVRELDKEQLDLCDYMNLSKRLDIPARMVLACIDSQLGMITPEVYAKG